MTNPQRCGIIIVSRGGEYTNPQGSNDNAQAGGVGFALKKYERKFQKPLDKSAKMWYNISTKEVRGKPKPSGVYSPLSARGKARTGATTTRP